jgi:hypothetical protein
MELDGLFLARSLTTTALHMSTTMNSSLDVTATAAATLWEGREVAVAMKFAFLTPDSARLGMASRAAISKHLAGR